MKTIHNIPPVFDKDSRILILGSFPSVKSREGRFFYHHPQNRFWRVLASVAGCPTPQSIDEKREFLLNRHIALWDVIQSCDIESSADSSIKNVRVNDLSLILNNADIKAVFANGRTAGTLYDKHCRDVTGIPAKTLPSTSPANAAWSLEALIKEWRIIKDFIF